MNDTTITPRGLKKLLDQAGSDKGTWYGDLYDVLLQPQRRTVKCVFEIGIGTMIPTAESSMVGWAGENYKPGNSLRALRDFLPNAEIHGFDVALDTQFDDEPRITTHLCDSTSIESTAAVLRNIPLKPDIIIDDGLHTRIAQIRTMKNFLPSLRDGGLYIVEDVIVPDDAKAILETLSDFRPSAHAFCYQTSESWSAVIIRLPEFAFSPVD